MATKPEEELLNARLPLWLQFPEMPRYSIGWRMGGGESYVAEFGGWWETLSPEAQRLYEARYPEPPDWQGWYAGEEEDDDSPEQAAT